MSFLGFEIYKFILCFQISIYLLNIGINALAVKDNADSNGINFQQDDINLNEIYSNKKFKCPKLYGAFPDVEDCSKFYICVFGVAAHSNCPPFTNFDKYRKKCVAKIVAICDKGKEGKETTLPDKQISTAKDTTFSCPSMLGSFPHSTDCSKYYKCTFFVPVLKTCPENELFDGVKKECKPENEVNCGSRTRPTSETTFGTTPLIPKSTTPEPSTPEETTQKLTTPQATPAETTPESTTPEPTTEDDEPTGPPDNDCDEDDLDCIITETGLIPKWFKCPVELGSHRHPSSKKLFIFCINWQPFVKKCGQDLVYSPELETCVTPLNLHT